jgi:HNH endonuclease
VAKPNCSVPGCEREIHARGWCRLHYRRWSKHGDVLADVPIKHFDRGLTLEETFRRCMPEEPPPAGVIWLWRGWIDPNGYGKLAHKGRSYWAHRVSYTIFRDPIPEGMFVLHSTDVGADVNPWNLRVGTHADNMNDMVSRGRSSRYPLLGTENGLARLTDDDVREIRALHAAGGWTQAALGKRFAVSRENVREIIHRRTWPHI